MVEGADALGAIVDAGAGRAGGDIDRLHAEGAEEVERHRTADANLGGTVQAGIHAALGRREDLQVIALGDIPAVAPRALLRPGPHGDRKTAVAGKGGSVRINSGGP